MVAVQEKQLSDSRASYVSNSLHSVESALALMLSRAQAISRTEQVDVHESVNRTLACDYFTSINLPSCDNSAMDGYAVRTADLLENAPTVLPITQRIEAGTVSESLEAGQAARIFTGAPIPDNADAVVIQEHCQETGGWVHITHGVTSGSNIRRAGEDVRRGDRVLSAGTRLGLQHIAMATAIGLQDISVSQRPRVAVFVTGNELVAPGNPLGTGQIYDSNRQTFLAVLKSLGCEVIDLGRVPDTLEATCNALARGTESADLIVSSGGISVGEEDHVRAAVQTLGQIDLWRIAMRPGKPVAFGQIDNVPFIGLPGNPVSMFVSCVLFIRPFVLRLQGTINAVESPVRVKANFDCLCPGQHREYARARLETSDNGTTYARIFDNRSPGAISSLTWATGLVIIPEGQTVRMGDMVDYLPFNSLLY